MLAADSDFDLVFFLSPAFVSGQQATDGDNHQLRSIDPCQPTIGRALKLFVALLGISRRHQRLFLRSRLMYIAVLLLFSQCK